MKTVRLENLDGHIAMVATVMNNGVISFKTTDLIVNVTPEAFAEFNRKIRLEAKHIERLIDMAKRIK